MTGMQYLLSLTLDPSNARQPHLRFSICPRPARMRHSTATSRSTAIVGIWMQPNICTSHRLLLLREHQVQILNRSTGCAFAEIIENGGQQDLPVFDVRKYA
jgi:hypothetical protein